MPDPSGRSRVASIALIVGGLGLALYLWRRPAASTPAAPGSARASALAAADDPAAAAPREQKSHARVEQRRARDELRAKILAAIEEKRRAAASRPPPAAKPASSAAPDDGPPGLDKDYIQQTFRDDMFPLLRKCYESALAQRPALAGKLVLDFTIEGDADVGGVVEDADFDDASTLHDDEMRTCVRESLMTLTFDKPPRGGGKVTVKYPLAFSPGPDPSDSAAPAQ
ncbi:MAG TPA: AgmX/PglI C-terminal domain-containing protein [Byssovorax sp.]|jgi:hypothetical protein